MVDMEIMDLEEEESPRVISQFYKKNADGKPETVYVWEGKGTYTETLYGIVFTTPSGNTSVLYPWTQILEVWYR